ncbi:MAG: phage holin family protein [Bifidobacteriaceae bacterium]|jgi:hypothetical protein|nr:phage holin family protein [Bifidobacteriaceae bacterium]
MAEQGLGATLRRAAEQVSGLAKITGEVVKAQLAKDGTRLGVGLALIALAAVFLLGVVPLLVFALVWGLVQLGLQPWAAYLITAGLVLVLGAILALAGRSLLKRAAGAISETTETIKGSIAALGGTPAPASDQGDGPAGVATADPGHGGGPGGAAPPAAGHRGTPVPASDRGDGPGGPPTARAGHREGRGGAAPPGGWAGGEATASDNGPASRLGGA